MRSASAGIAPRKPLYTEVNIFDKLELACKHERRAVGKVTTTGILASAICRVMAGEEGGRVSHLVISRVAFSPTFI